jgi:ATP-binding cassette subfamily B protein
VEVLKGLDASILPGEHVALVGKSGAGKSTLARLIARLYDPWEGEIRWEGHDLRDVPLPELRRKVGLLTQRVSIFRDTVLENVRLWAPGVDRRKAIEACYAVGAHRFIEGLPKGYDTSLTPGGKELSAGERQLIAYARVLVQRPELLVLDEPTANVDQDTEQRILDATAKVMAGRTVILIAHRLSTLRAAERVWFMDEGKLVEDGTPGELLAHSSQFRRMADRYRAAADWQERSAAHGE